MYRHLLTLAGSIGISSGFTVYCKKQIDNKLKDQYAEMQIKNTQLSNKVEEVQEEKDAYIYVGTFGAILVFGLGIMSGMKNS